MFKKLSDVTAEQKKENKKNEMKTVFKEKVIQQLVKEILRNKESVFLVQGLFCTICLPFGE